MKKLIAKTFFLGLTGEYTVCAVLAKNEINGSLTMAIINPMIL
jgi:hypothetical protein